MLETSGLPADDADGDDFLACSDLCEENHFFLQAAMLRAMAGAGGKVFIVAERNVDYDDEIYSLVGDDGQPQSLFFDRADAEVVALHRNASKFRDLYPRDYGFTLDRLSSLSETELNRQIGAILGGAFDLYSFDRDECPFPESATDEQMMAVARLFDKLQFFHVIEAEFGG